MISDLASALFCVFRVYFEDTFALKWGVGRPKLDVEAHPYNRAFGHLQLYISLGYETLSFFLKKKEGGVETWHSA